MSALNTETGTETGSPDQQTECVFDADDLDIPNAARELYYLEEWECSRPVWEEASGNRCVWHTSDGQKPYAELEKTVDDGDLHGSAAIGVNLSGIDFPVEAGFIDADLSGASLGRADLPEADLRGADLSRATLHFADLSGATLHFADLSGAYLSGGDLSGATLRYADLSEADLSGGDLRGADLSGATLRGANLPGTDLRGADLSEADLSGATLRYADLSEARLINADLSEADLPGATLSEADLVDAELSEADLSGATLVDAEVSEADLVDAEVSEADLSEATFAQKALRERRQREEQTRKARYRRTSDPNRRSRIIGTADVITRALIENSYFKSFIEGIFLFVLFSTISISVLLLFEYELTINFLAGNPVEVVTESVLRILLISLLAVSIGYASILYPRLDDESNHTYTDDDRTN